MFSTIEDIYVSYIDTDRGQKEKVRFYDTAGLVSLICYVLTATRSLYSARDMLKVRFRLQNT